LGGTGASRFRTVRRIATLLLLSGVALAATGCGARHSATPAELHLERADLVAVSRALATMRPALAGEVAATKAAWPFVVNGLPANLSTIPHTAIQRASARAAALRVPGLFEEPQAASLTGRGSTIAGRFRTAVRLAARGWRLIGAAIAEIEHGSPPGARFARANVALYIESVYDAHFSLAQIGKQLLAGYKNLGGAPAFGASLTEAEVEGLAASFSEANDRLHPHTGVRLGS
jgi:hypothetical protein